MCFFGKKSVLKVRLLPAFVDTFTYLQFFFLNVTFRNILSDTFPLPLLSIGKKDMDLALTSSMFLIKFFLTRYWLSFAPLYTKGHRILVVILSLGEVNSLF